MLATIDQVKELTRYDVTLETLTMAQAVIESYTGKLEIDVTDARDQYLMGVAVAYQAAYMFNEDDDYSKTFEQIAVQQMNQYGSFIMFKANDNFSPFVAPHAVIACRGLSWKRSRSISAGSLFDGPYPHREWVTD